MPLLNPRETLWGLFEGKFQIQGNNIRGWWCLNKALKLLGCVLGLGKASDKVDHRFPFDKMEGCGLDGPITKWIPSKLKNYF